MTKLTPGDRVLYTGREESLRGLPMTYCGETDTQGYGPKETARVLRDGDLPWNTFRVNPADLTAIHTQKGKV